MKRKNLAMAVPGVALAALVMIGNAPSVYADTTAQSTPQDLTSLAAISTTITGQPDPTFAKDEQKYQTASITSQTTWTGFCHQGGREITIQFPNPVDVQHVKITMEQKISSGIYYPSEVDFQAFSNGQWFDVGTQNNGLSSDDATPSTQTFQLNRDPGIETSAIRIYFPVGIYVFARGLDVTWSTTQSGVTLSPGTVPTVNSNDGTQASGALTPASPNDYGIQNMLMVPTGSYGSLGTWAASDFIPMLAYVNQTGSEVAPLFDTMLFSPYSDIPNTMAGLTGYVNDLFKPGQELSALNQAVAQVNQTLNRPGYKEKVAIAVPYFPFGATNFGNIDGQPLSFTATPADPDAVNSRTTALEWYIDTILANWKSANYQNLQLVGLYWNHEQYDIGSPGEQQMFQTAEFLAHNNGLPLFWIPFYGAEGSTQWQSLGLDAAWLQPNYIEQGAGASIDRITSATQIAKQNGMGVEVELTGLDSTTTNLYSTFLNTLETDRFGGSNVSHAYYDGSKLILTAEQSSNPTERAVYDETAQFIFSGTKGAVGN